MSAKESETIMFDDGYQCRMPVQECSKEVKNIGTVSLHKLCKGFLELYVDDLKSITCPLDEVDRNQAVLIETVQQENARFIDARQTCNLEEMFNKLSYYQSKLIAIKKDMVSLHDRTLKLKRRTLKLQSLKERQNAQKPSPQ